MSAGNNVLLNVDRDSATKIQHGMGNGSSLLSRKDRQAHKAGGKRGEAKWFKP